MKVYISADIEGVTGIADFDEARKHVSDYREFQLRMTQEVAAAAEAAVHAGATEVWIKDAHATGRNLLADRLPREVRLIRGWSGHPLSMVQELDESFSAVLMVGYHAAAGSGGNPLAHTMNGRRVHRMTINGARATEFHLHTYAAAEIGVPVTFLSGDHTLCDEVSAFDARIRTVATMQGVGASTVSLHPAVAQDAIRAGVRESLATLPRSPVDLPADFEVTLTFAKPAMAYRASHYPGAHLVQDDTIGFSASRFLEVLRLILFVV